MYFTWENRMKKTLKAKKVILELKELKETFN